jgi:hypothetical protein
MRKVLFALPFLSLCSIASFAGPGGAPYPQQPQPANPSTIYGPCPKDGESGDPCKFSLTFKLTVDPPTDRAESATGQFVLKGSQNISCSGVGNRFGTDGAQPTDRQGEMKAIYTIPDDAASGTYELKNVSATVKVGDDTTSSGTQLMAPLPSITVKNPDADKKVEECERLSRIHITVTDPVIKPVK